MLRILLAYALDPPMRATVWLKKKRALRVLTVVRHVQALADRWMHAILQSERTLRRFLQRACATRRTLSGEGVAQKTHHSTKTA